MGKEIKLDPQSHGVTGPAKSTDILYRAFKRPYTAGGANVIVLLASCSYPVGGYTIYFTREYGPDEVYTLMEQAPGIWFDLVTYYAAEYTSGYGVVTTNDYVTIKDAHGSHRVPLETMG